MTKPARGLLAIDTVTFLSLHLESGHREECYTSLNHKEYHIEAHFQ